MQQVIDERHLADTDAMRQGFQRAKPFRHLAISDFLTPGFYERVKAEFPTANADEMLSEFGDASSKHTVESISGLGPAFREWDGMLRSVEFIGWLEAVTGIEGLIFDPAYVGAGTHNNLHGQSLDLHIDFNHLQTTRYHRRLNLMSISMTSGMKNGAARLSYIEMHGIEVTMRFPLATSQVEILPCCLRQTSTRGMVLSK